MKAHFFDIDTLIKFNNKAWIVDKNKPSKPIMKISKSDLSLISSGIYRKQGNKIEFNGKIFWLPTDMYNEIKVKAKFHKSNLSDLAISLQEFYNKDIIDNINFDLNLDLILKLKNKLDDVYVICSKQTKRNYEGIISIIENKLREQGIKIKHFYYISETLYKKDDDFIKYKKMRLLLQHLIGYKTKGDLFLDKEITRYDEVYYYDNNLDTFDISTKINDVFMSFLTKTPDGLRDVIKEDVSFYKPFLEVNKVNDNQFNRMETKKVFITVSSIIKTFESFTFLNKLK